MTRTIRSHTMLALLMVLIAALSACRESEQGRLRRMQQRVAADSIAARSSIVQTLRAPHDLGRLIYDKPIDLSYTTLRKTRPDLDSANDARRKPGADAAAPLDTNRTEAQSIQRRHQGRP